MNVRGRLGVRPGLTEIDFSEGPTPAPSPPTLSINDVSQAEGDSGQTLFEFTVSLSAPASQDVTVQVTTQAGSADEPNDYDSVNTVAILLAGQTQVSVQVAVNGDTDPEVDETFAVLLSNSQGATLGDGAGLGTIENDDVVPTSVPFERFTGSGDAFDLDHTRVLFTPGPTGTTYDVSVGAITELGTELPTDPAGGVELNLGDDDSQRVDLSPGHTVSLYGQSFSSFYVGSNGNITFTEQDRDFTESEADHLDTLRISAFFDDLDPTQGGQVSVQQLTDRVVVTWDGVSQFGQADSNTFQVEMYYDGRIGLAWVGISALDGIVGLSDGQGLRPGLEEIDLSVL